MKKYLSLTIVSLTFLGLGSLTSCQDEDLGVSTQTLKERAFDDAFVKQFGKPSANQSWDFYTQAVQSLGKGGAITRASGAGWSVTGYVAQPAYITPALVQQYDDFLPENDNNYTKGQTDYSLISTGDGNFTISAIWYGGGFETNTDVYGFNFYLHFKDNDGNFQRELLFTGGDKNGNKMWNDNSDHGFGNPGMAVDVHLDEGIEFWFEIEYWQKANSSTKHHFYSNSDGHAIQTYNYEKYPEYYRNATAETRFPYEYYRFRYKERDYYHIYNGPSQLLYSAYEYGEDQISHFMVIGFEDCWEDLDFLDFDYNDIVLYIDGDLPLPVAKRVLVEDLEQFDWDYNDVVFDIEYKRMVLRAVGGTKPVYLEFVDNDGNETVTEELHELMAKHHRVVDDEGRVTYPYANGAPKIEGTNYYKPINVDASNGVDMMDALIKQWDDPLNDEQIQDMGTHHDIIVLVGDGEDQVEAYQVSKTDKNGNTVITYAAGAKGPAIIMAPVETRWMKELQLIKLGYPTFFDGRSGSGPDGVQTLEDYWFSVNVKTDYLYY